MAATWLRGAVGALLAAIALTGVSARDNMSPTPASLAFGCNGSHDLLISGGRITLSGHHSYDRVCVQDGGTLFVPDVLTLRTGILYVDSGSAISADGTDAYQRSTHDCIDVGGITNGGAGGQLTLIARQAFVAGLISAGGGHGADNGGSCSVGTLPMGAGGRAGDILLEAQNLQLHGRIIAIGGSGGAGTAVTDVPAARAHSGNGGEGGHVVVAVAHPTATLRRALAVEGGQAGARGAGPRGADGRSGTVQIQRLTSVQQQGLPPSPAPLTMIAGKAPAQAHLDPHFETTHHMQCRPGDLVVPPGGLPSISGVQRFRHVCIGRDSLVDAAGNLTIIAETISIAPGARLMIAPSEGVLPTSRASGQYESAGGCQANHAPPHSGVAGSAMPDAAARTDPDYETPGAPAGAGGGRLTLIAHAILLAGTVSADGAPGQDGAYDPNDPNHFALTQGGGGGSGGGVYLVAQDIQVTGQVSAVGGTGGMGADQDHEAGMHGGPGCIKILAGALRTPPGAAPFIGPTVIGHIRSTDPSPSLPTTR